IVVAAPGRADVIGFLEHDDLEARQTHGRGASKARRAGSHDDGVGRLQHRYLPHTSCATSTARRSLAHCSSSVRMLPSSVEANPHCGDSASWSMGANLEASSSLRLISSLFSSAPLL